MSEPAPHTRDTIGTIRRNAGKIPPDRLAEELGWTLSRLESVARHHGFDLKYTQEEEAEPVAPPPAPRPTSRSIHVNVQLYPADIAAIDVVGRSFGIKRARVIIRLVENALARGILANLAHMPAPRRLPTLAPDDAPEGVQVDTAIP